MILKQIKFYTQKVFYKRINNGFLIIVFLMQIPLKQGIANASTLPKIPAGLF